MEVAPFQLPQLTLHHLFLRESGCALAWLLAVLLLLVLALVFPFLFPPPFTAATFLMPATPPPSSPHSPSPHSPPTSPQLYQQAARNQEHFWRDVGSSELRRVPSASTTLFSVFPPLPSPPRPISAPVNFNEHSYSHLPPHLLARMRDLQPFSAGAQRAHQLPQPQLNVSFLLLLFYFDVTLNF